MEQGQKVEVISVLIPAAACARCGFGLRGRTTSYIGWTLTRSSAPGRCLTWALKPSFSFAGPDGSERERVLELKYTIRTHCWSLLRWVY